MVTPFAIALAGDRLYVTDFDGNRIKVFTREGLFVETWGAPGSGPGEFRGPAGIAIDHVGSVYVTDLYNHRVQRFSADGVWLASWGERGNARDQLGGPLGIAVDSDGSVLVTELDNHRVHRFSNYGTTLGVWGTRGHGSGELDDPWGIAVDERGVVYVADHGNDRIARFSKDGAWLGAVEPAGVGSEPLAGPTGLALGPDGSLYVADLQAPLPRLIDRDGKLRATWSEGTSPGPSPGTTAFAVNASGEMFIADAGGGRVGRVAVESRTGIAARTQFRMAPADPTPSSGSVALRFVIPTAGDLEVEVFSVEGRRVHRTPIERCEPGDHAVTWDARNEEGVAVPAGVYFARVRFDDRVQKLVRTGRIVVLR